MASKKYSATLFFGGRVIEIACDHGREPVIRIPEPVDADEMAALNCIVETLRCLSSGKSIDHHFNPTVDNVKMDALVLCRWERSGRLRIISEAPGRHYRHASTIQEAISRRRNFTCNRSVMERLPLIREAAHGQES